MSFGQGTSAHRNSEQSDASSNERHRLHARVRAFIDRCAAGRGPGESFDELALAIMTYQAARVPAYARLCASAGIQPAAAKDPRLLPAVPTDVFRLTRVAAHPPDCDAVVFRTSGTTATERGA